MSYATSAYSQVSDRTISPRSLEAELLQKAAARLDAASSNDRPYPEEDRIAALEYNEKLWIVFVSSAFSNSNPLPASTRSGIASLGRYVLRQTVNLIVDHDTPTMKSLVDINRQIAAGLRGSPGVTPDNPQETRRGDPKSD